jgi:hypothetical protein
VPPAETERIPSPAFVSAPVLRRGVEPEGTEGVRVSGRDATLVVWSADYNSKGKA